MTDQFRIRAIFPIVALGMSLAFSGAAQARDTKAWVEVGGSLPSIDTVATITPSDQQIPSASINFEDDLAFSKRELLPEIRAGIWLSDSWNLQADFYKIARSSNHSIDREIEFDGVTFPVSANVDSRFSSDVYRLTVGYQFLDSETVRLGAQLGLHLTSFEVALEGEAIINGEVLPTASRKRRDLLAPLPTLGLYAQFDLTDDLTLAADVNYFTLGISGFKGEMLNFEAKASYALTDGLRGGVMWRVVNYEFEFEKDTFSGSVEYNYSGPGLFLRLEL